jgi:hypothetical protein
LKKLAHQDSPGQMLLFADIVPNGSGGFVITPRKPVQEITSKEAARILGVAHSHMSNIVNMPKAQKILIWRWTSEAHGKRLFDLQSVLAYRALLQDGE